MKEQLMKVKSNPLGFVVGGAAGYLVAAKLIKTEKMWVKIAAAVVGGVAGAMAQAQVKAKKGAPTAEVVKK
jgi:3-oxoacyl-(acyl-carrier-protein) synthase